MPEISFSHLIGHKRAKEVLGGAFLGGTLGHAYLLCGDAGCGPFAAAVDMARALLCTSTVSVPCNECAACKRIVRGAHPDLHVVVPVALQNEHKSDDGLSEEGISFVNECVLFRITCPYEDLVTQSAPSMPVAWIRQVMRDVNRGPVEGKNCVVIIDGADMLEDASANAMLKTLEEPPAHTYIFLVTSRFHGVLPTIVSRSQTIRFGGLPVEDIKCGLSKYCDQDLSEETITLAIESSMGSLSRAIAFAKTPDTEALKDAQELLKVAMTSDWLVIAPLVDKLAQSGSTHLKSVFLSALHSVRSSMFLSAALSETYIKESGASGNSVIPITNPSVAGRLTTVFSEAIGAVESYGNAGLILVNLCMQITEIIHGKKC